MTDASLKKRAAAEALTYVEAEMTLGLGTGSTAAAFVELLGARVKDGLYIKGVPTSEETARLAQSVGVVLVDPDETTQIDLAIDGADEVDAQLNLIKGGGGALLREKIIADAAKRFIVIADDAKKVGALGAFPLPVEIDQFAWPITVRRIRETLAHMGFSDPELTLRSGPEFAFVSDGGNFIIDCKLERIDAPADLDRALRALPGVVETGLFAGIADVVILAGANGVETLTR